MLLPIADLLRPLVEYEQVAGGSVVSGAAASSLPEMLGRLKLTAMRDRLDVLLDEAARRELNLARGAGLCCARPRWRTARNGASRWG